MAYLTKDQVRQIVANRPNGTTPQQVVSKLLESHQLEGYAPVGASSQSSGGFGGFPSGPNAMSPLASLGAQAKGAVAGALPWLGGAAGGIIGGALGSPVGPAGTLAGGASGAALGGDLGERGRQWLMGEVQNTPKAELSGVGQAAADVVGQGLAAGVGAVARPLMRRALQIGQEAFPRFAQPDLSAVTRGIPVSVQGAQKANAAREASAQVLQDLLDRAKVSGRAFDQADLEIPFQEVAANRALPSEERATIARNFQNFARDQGYVPPTTRPSLLLDARGNPMPTIEIPGQSASIDPELLKEVKQLYQTRGSSVYENAAAGSPSIAEAPLRQFSATLGSSAKRALETIPGVARQEGNTQELIALQRAIENRLGRAPEAINILHPGTWPLGVANNPETISKLAIALGDPGFQATLRQSPRLLAALVALSMNAAPSDQTNQQFLTQPVGR